MVVIKIGDGMGNQMFNYACGYAIARQDKEKLKLDISECDNSSLRDYELDFFKIQYEEKESFPNRNIWQKIYKRLRRNLKYHVLIEKDLFAVDERIFKKYHRDKYLHGYWQNVEYFKEYLPELRALFVPKGPLKKEVREQIENLQNTITCAVHVRGGDINGPSRSYFEKAMKMMQERKPGVRFLIFTNDRKKAAECIGDQGNTGVITYVDELGTFSDKEEFLLMSSCRNQIISNSSYSTWAAYLNPNTDQIVMLPDYKGAAQMCLPGWLVIKA